MLPPPNTSSPAGVMLAYAILSWSSLKPATCPQPSAARASTSSGSVAITCECSGKMPVLK
ncbi:hypothetical protein BE20_38530 [Sorangium cellulosum]|nr:hypothetical protein BE20_38530 [Sorangium cellulosum]